MLKQKLFFIFALFLLVGATAVRAQSMTDDQVLQYVKDGMQQGKDQRQMATELARRGVTRAQAERVKKLYESQNPSGESTMGTVAAEDRLREQVREDSVLVQSRQTEEVTADQVFGRNIFNTRNLTFEPSVNLATPPNYRLGPGDEVIIDIWGANQNSIRSTISPDGYINIQNIGLVYLNGMTVEEANDFLRKELNKIYSGVDASQPTSQIKLTLGNTRTIQINVMGEVVQPGTYALSAFSTVFHALYRAGGVNDLGSLRDVQLVRGGKKVAVVDVYDFIMQGKVQDDIRLQEGDVVLVPPYEALVQVDGKVKRPMRYEMKTDESLATLLRYAGGFTADAYTQAVRVVRQNGKEYQVATVDRSDYSAFQLRDGDVMTVDAILDRFENKLEVRGAVYRPGIYQLGREVQTVRQLIEKADGLTGDAFLNRAVLYRERDNLTHEVLQLDIRGIMEGTSPDVALSRNDVLYIPSIHDLQDWGPVTITGEVPRPGEYPYADNMTLEDLVIQAGGLNDAASLVRVDVSRRIKDPQSTNETDERAHLYTFALKDGFVIDGEAGFTLQPYDQVFVRRSPAYSEQLNVSIGGEVNYGGTYTLSNKNERLSDLVRKAGGVTKFAYVKGTKLVRRANAEEKERMAEVIRMIQRETGIHDLDSLNIRVEDTFTVGINLEEALAAPGTDADVVLREGDRLEVPEYDNTVRIAGAVMVPNTVVYTEGNSFKDYLSQAGGYANNARKRSAFIVYMNGQVAEVKGSGRKQIEPGCQIIVPAKMKRQNLAQTLATVSSFSTVAMTIATIANLISGK